MTAMPQVLEIDLSTGGAVVRDLTPDEIATLPDIEEATERDKTDAEYAEEWPAATAQRQRDILAIKLGLLPREKVSLP